MIPTVAIAVYKYTYTLGRSIYVPLTCRCNSTPLTITRGPGFHLPKEVVEALVRVRNAECPDAGPFVCLSNENRAVMPPFPKEWLVNSLYKYDDPFFFPKPQSFDAPTDDNDDIIDDLLEPSISTLISEVISRLETKTTDSQHSPAFEEVVIAGEGEPTLRMDALLAVARTVQSFRHEQKQNDLAVRVITNGLCYGIPNLGYSPENRKRIGVIPMHRHTILRDMLEAGVTRLSVALNTANRHEYDVLMEPCCYTGGGVDPKCINSEDFKHIFPGTAHDIVCEFIMEAIKVGFDLEVTGVDRPDVDKVETIRLVRLLMSVGEYKMRKIRWRRYFE